MKVVNDLLTALDNGNISVPSLLDLSAVVDTIDHKSLFFRLESSYGISDTALAWFRSFLSIAAKQFQSMVVTHHIHSLNTGSHKVQFWDQYCSSCVPSMCQL